MHIIIQNFRSYENYELKIDDGSLTLINGTSGAGKTTIFEAIKWALYGKLKNYAPFNKPKAKTYVSLKFDRLFNKCFIVERQANPTNLIVTVGNTTYEGNDAQNQITRYFGPIDVFQAAAYIDQGSRNYLLDATQSDRLDILNYLTFSNDNPGLIRDKLTTNINETKKKYDMLMTHQDTDTKRFEEFKALFTEDEITTLSNTNSEELATTIKRYEGLYQDLNDKYQKIVASIKEYNAAKTQEDNYRLQLTTLKSTLLSETKLQEMQTQISNINNNINMCDMQASYKAHMQMEDDIIAKLNKLNIIGDINVSDKDYKDALNTEAIYKTNEAIARKYSVQYDADIIKLHINNIRKKLDIQPLLQAYDKLNDYDDNIKNSSTETLKAKITAIHTLIDEAKMRLADIKRSKNIVVCPHCNGNVRLVAEADRLVLKPESASLVIDNNTKIYEDKIAELNKSIAILNSDITKRENYEKDVNVFNSLNTLNTLNIDYKSAERLSKSAIASLKTEITQLQNLTYVTLPVISSTDISNHIKAKELKVNLNKLQSIRPAYNGEITLNKKQLILERDDLLKQIQANLAIKAKVENIESLLSALKPLVKPKIEELNKIQEDCKLAKHELDNAKALFAKYKSFQQLTVHSAEIEKRYNDIDVTVDRHNMLTAIKDIATKLENTTLTQTVYTINKVLADVVNHIFDKSIEINLRLHRQLKTRDIVKPEVGITVIYHGVQYTSFTQLSGGELGRASIALLLALAQVNLSPILLLDEASSFLDAEHREKVIEILRIVAKDKTILVISHEEVTGMYDNVIHICS